MRTKTLALGLTSLLAHAGLASAAPWGPQDSAPTETLSLLSPPAGVVVDASFLLRDVNEIDEGAETFSFTGVLTMTWRDPRQAFSPEAFGAPEKLYQGEFQFNELSPAWYPQVTLVNDAGNFRMNGVILRVLPDGTSTLMETISAVAEMEISMRRYPFDAHRIEATFELLGVGQDEVRFRVASDARNPAGQFRVPQWELTGSELSVEDPGNDRAPSRFVLGIEIAREPFYLIRLVVFPLAVIVMLSFCVFWMDRSSAGDRLNISFIGILTGVTYNLVIGDNLPQIAYFTLIHGFLNLSFVTMCATVLVNLTVSSQDKKGNFELGDRIDRHCRWAFPLTYVTLNLAMLAAAFTVFE